MSIRNTNNNLLLSTVVRFLNSGDVRYEKILKLVDDSTTEVLIPTFAFIGFWLSNNINNKPEKETMQKLQLSFHLIEIISRKVPPVILLSGLNDLNWGMHQPNWLLRESLLPMFGRLEKLRHFVFPNCFENYIDKLPVSYPSSDIFWDLKHPALSFEIECNPVFSLSAMSQIRKLIASHSPICAFKPLLTYRNSKITLTRIMIEMIKEIGSSNATHSQQLVSYSLLMMYLNSFILSNDVDGHLIADYILNKPYVSPFLMVAVANHITQNLYLYNLLIPREHTNSLSNGLSNPISMINHQYNIVDTTSDTSLNHLIQSIPTILTSYFFAIPHDKKIEHPPENDDNFLQYILLCGTSINERTNAIYSNSDKKDFSFKHISAMSYPLMKNLLSILANGKILEFERQKKFSERLCKLYSTIITFILPTYEDFLCQHFLEKSSNNPEICNTVIKAILLHLLPSILTLSYEKRLLPFLFSCIKMASTNDECKDEKLKEEKVKDDLLLCSRLLIIRLLRFNVPLLSSELGPLLLSCSDIVVLLEYIDSIENYSICNNYQESHSMNLLKEQLIKKLPFHSEKSEIYKIEQTLSVPINVFNAYSQKCIKIISSLNQPHFISNVSKYLQTDDKSIDLLVRVLSMTNAFNSDQLSQNITEYLCNQLRNNVEATSTPSQFVIYSKDISLTTSQAVFCRLLVFGRLYDAKKLLESMKDMICSSSTPIHWIVMVLRTYKKYFDDEMSEVFRGILLSLKQGFPFKFDCPVSIKAISKKLNSYEAQIIYDHSIFDKEYFWPYKYYLECTRCYYLLDQRSVSDIVEEFLIPLKSTMTSWKNREESCINISNMVSGLSNDMIYAFFSSLLSCRYTTLSIKMAQKFFGCIHLEPYKRICMNCGVLINGDTEKLNHFIHMILSSILRLKSEESIATHLLCGFLEAVSQNTPAHIQEEVIDAVGFGYISLKLQKSRPELISASKNFPPHLKALIASSLEISSLNGNGFRDYGR